MALASIKPQFLERPLLCVIDYPFHGHDAAMVTLKNLLETMDPKEFIVMSQRSDTQSEKKVFQELGPRKFKKLPWRLSMEYEHLYFLSGQSIRRIISVAKKNNCGGIFAVYPNTHAIAAAYEASKILNIPCFIWLHDTIAEGTQGTRFEKFSAEVQKKLFSDSSITWFSMSDGLRDLILKKYKIDSMTLPHCYNEEPAYKNVKFRAHAKPRFFYSGTVYGINRPAVGRVARAAVSKGFEMVCTSAQTKRILIEEGCDSTSVQLVQCPDRSDYLKMMAEQDALLLALSWPDESRVHRDELATIFPTKTPEYFGSGRPIFLHAPEDYFISKFFVENKCGVYCGSRDEATIAEELQKLLSAQSVAENAIKILPYFHGDRIGPLFREALLSRLR